MMKKLNLLMFVISVIVLIVLFVIQFNNGLNVTGLNDKVVWGAYITGFTFSLGMAAGVLLLVFYLLLRDELSEGMQLKLSVGAIISLIMAGIFITLDLGRPERFYLFLTSPNFKSPLVWDFWVMNTLIVISVFLIFSLIGKKKISKSLSVVLMLVTFIAYFITTEAFSGLRARINWNFVLLNIDFILMSLLSGGALYLVFKNENSEDKSFNIVFSALLLIEAVVFFTGFKGRFSILYLLAGNIVPMILILIVKNNSLNALMSFLILTSIWFKREDIIFSGYKERWISTLNVNYSFNKIEFMLVLNIFLSAIFALLLFSSVVHNPVKHNR